MSDTTELAMATPDLPALYQQAIQLNSSPEALQKLFELQQAVEAANAKRAFFSAIQRFQEICPQISKDKKAPNNRYASLEQVDRVIRPFLAQCGLSYSFDSELADGVVTVVCKVRHIDGHIETSRFASPVSDVIKSREGKTVTNGMQMAAMSHTYAKRYALQDALGLTITEEDTDGNDPPQPPKARDGGPVAQPRADRVTKEDLTDLHGYWRETMTGLGGDTGAEAFRQFIVDNGGPSMEPNKANSWTKDQLTSVGKAVDRLRGEA